MRSDEIPDDISRAIWESRYRAVREEATEEPERSIEDTWRRVARAVAAAEAGDRSEWEERFYALLQDYRFLPGGRILAGAGASHQVTLFNCFVMGRIEDSMDGIFDALREGAVTMQQGGGVGYDFSTLRPRGSQALSTGTTASGPVSFMRIWDSMCATVLSTGARRGAMMATLRCDHPDIEEFVEAKRDERELRRFNLSVLVSDELMEAVRDDDEWPLVYPAHRLGGSGGETVSRAWSGEDTEVPCRVLRVVRARDLWEKIMRSTYEFAEPGVLFVDRIAALNNLGYRERISATNPCGEIPLPPYGACNLGSINLTRFVLDAFRPTAQLDMSALQAVTEAAVRFLDDVIDVSRFPLPSQREQALGTRRLGLGLTGLADALAMVGVGYGEPRGRQLAADVMRTICRTAYRTSVALAREKGPFPFYEANSYLKSGFVATLPEEIRDLIAEHGIRNSHLTAIAPSGTISLLAGNVSSGVEPIFDYRFARRLVGADGEERVVEVTDHAVAEWARERGSEPLPPAFVRAHEISPEAHVEMQAALQEHVDSAISKTVIVPETLPFDAFRNLYALAWERGLKGCTTFRPNPVTGAVLESVPSESCAQEPHCCGLGRESD